MRALLALACVLLVSGQATAHDVGLAITLSGGTWTYDPWVVAPLYLAGCLYLAGTWRLWRRVGFGRGIPPWRTGCFWAGWFALALALVSPVHWLGERLFVMHMIEHALLIVVAAPLIALARPTAAALWALPRTLGHALAHLVHQRAIVSMWATLTDPLFATFLHGFAIWAWHTPRLYDLAVTNETVHRFQHLSFSLTALLFWWALVRTNKHGVAVFCLFFTALHTSLLGVLLTLSTHLWYPPQVALAADWGLSPLEDQQLAGLVMWVPMGIIYVGAALGFAALWISTASRQASTERTA